MSLTVARPSNEDRIRAALWFAEHGFGVFSVWSTTPEGVCRCPQGKLCQQPGKHPVPAVGFKAATSDPGRITTMLSAASEPNYGLVCPDGVFVWDVDGDGVPRLAELEREHGPLPPTLRTNTAHGQHVFLRWPEALPRPIGQMFGYVTRWGQGSGAGYVVGPRSVHASGVVYAPASAFLEIAEIPETWARALIAPKPVPELTIEIDGGYQLPDEGYTGPRYDAIRDYTASRYMRGISREEIFAGVVSVLAPRFADGLSEAELRSRFDRAWRGTPERLGEPLGIEAAPVQIPVNATPTTEMLPAWPDAPRPAAYHGPVGEIVQLVAGRTEADPVGVLGTLLAATGACMGHFRTIYQGSTQAANLFVVLVGDSSSGRKGTAGSIGRDVMNAAYPEWERLIVAGLGSGEGLVNYFKDRNEHRALVMESEFGRLLTVMAREGSTLSPIIRDAWDGVPMGRVLAKEQSLITWHHVGIVAHVTPVELRTKLTNTDAANGFGNRFLWLAVRRARLVPFPESPKGLIPQRLLDAISDAIADAQAPGEVPLAPDARDYWERLYIDLSLEQRSGLLGALVARTEAQIIRLALLYALLDRARCIEVEHLEASLAVWDYCAATVRYVFGSSTGNRDADALRSYLRDGPVEWETAKRCLGIRRASEIDEAIRTLVDLGVAEVIAVPSPRGGRPKRVIRIPGQTMQTLQTTQGTPPEKGA